MIPYNPDLDRVSNYNPGGTTMYPSTLVHVFTTQSLALSSQLKQQLVAVRIIPLMLEESKRNCSRQKKMQTQLSPRFWRLAPAFHEGLFWRKPSLQRHSFPMVIRNAQATFLEDCSRLGHPWPVLCSKARFSRMTRSLPHSKNCIINSNACLWKPVQFKQRMILDFENNHLKKSEAFLPGGDSHLW